MSFTSKDMLIPGLGVSTDDKYTAMTFLIPNNPILKRSIDLSPPSLAIINKQQEFTLANTSSLNNSNTNTTNNNNNNSLFKI